MTCRLPDRDTFSDNITLTPIDMTRMQRFDNLTCPGPIKVPSFRRRDCVYSTNIVHTGHEQYEREFEVPQCYKEEHCLSP